MNPVGSHRFRSVKDATAYAIRCVVEAIVASAKTVDPSESEEIPFFYEGDVGNEIAALRGKRTR